jgi:hypothetical protein
MIPARKAGHRAHVTDDGGGNHPAHAEDLGEARARGLHRSRQLATGLAHLRAGAAQVLGKLGGELAAGGCNGVRRGDRSQDRRGLACATASATVSHALRRGKLPQWRTRPEASRRIALSLGFNELGSQVSIRLSNEN